MAADADAGAHAGGARHFNASPLRHQRDHKSTYIFRASTHTPTYALTYNPAARTHSKANVQGLSARFSGLIE